MKPTALNARERIPEVFSLDANLLDKFIYHAQNTIAIMITQSAFSDKNVFILI